MPSRSILRGAAAVLAALFALTGPPALAAPTDGFPRLREQVVAHYAAGAPSAEIVKRTIARLREDGTWPDVDYTDRTRGGWRTARHMCRVLNLAQAYAKPGHALNTTNALLRFRRPAGSGPATPGAGGVCH